MQKQLPGPWVLRWLSRVDLTVNSRLHRSQRNGFSPVWIRTCRSRSLGFLKYLLHVEHRLWHFVARGPRGFGGGWCALLLVPAAGGCDALNVSEAELPWDWVSSSPSATAEFKPNNCSVNRSESFMPIITASANSISDVGVNLSNQTHLYSAVCRKKIGGTS